MGTNYYLLQNLIAKLTAKVHGIAFWASFRKFIALQTTKGITMGKDRTAICEIMSEMLDNPDDCGIYPTTEAYNKLEALVHAARTEAIGWTHADACCDLDAGRDPRQKEIPEMLERAILDLDERSMTFEEWMKANSDEYGLDVGSLPADVAEQFARKVWNAATSAAKLRERNGKNCLEIKKKTGVSKSVSRVSKQQAAIAGALACEIKAVIYKHEGAIPLALALDVLRIIETELIGNSCPN